MGILFGNKMAIRLNGRYLKVSVVVGMLLQWTKENKIDVCHWDENAKMDNMWNDLRDLKN